MTRRSLFRLSLVGLVLLGCLIAIVPRPYNTIKTLVMPPLPQLLTDPMLLWPTATSVEVVWFTEFAGTSHQVQVGDDPGQTIAATTLALSQMKEDPQSNLRYGAPDRVTPRPVWRHAATVTGLTPGDRQPYRVISVDQRGRSVRSEVFTLAALPPAGQPLNILLTSDHQSKPLTPANLQQVGATVDTVDAVFFAGDLVNVPDRASEWFDDAAGRAFFPSLQGRAHAEVAGRRYRGSAILQSAPLFPAIGNHEIMGRQDDRLNLNQQFNAPVPRSVAALRYRAWVESSGQTSPSAVDQTEWIKQASFNLDTVQELFWGTGEGNPAPDRPYYAVTVGDVRLIVLYATNIWRTPDLASPRPGRYAEAAETLADSRQWGFGQHIFEPIQAGSDQYTWLVSELQRSDWRQAKYRIVMLHHPFHSLGDNIVPAYTDPVQTIERDATGQITAVRYAYPQDQDYLIRDIEPLLEAADTDLVYFGHSHLWNRFIGKTGIHYLESSNVGNTYGAYVGDRARPVPPDQPDYVAIGDPNGLTPILPTLAPLLDRQGRPLPYVASNSLTVFTLLNTGTGQVTSYRFDPDNPAAGAIAFDQFQLS